MPSFIPTLDISNGNAVLVKSGEVDIILGNPIEMAKQLSIITYFQIVDIDRAKGLDNNKDLIKQITTLYPCYVGGGLRSLNDVNEMLNSSARRVVISTSSNEIIGKISKERLILACDVDDSLNIMYNGRTKSSETKLEEEIGKYYKDIEIVSVTFHEREGTLNGLNMNLVNKVKMITDKYKLRLIIAGGINSIDDIKMLQTNDIIPQFGRAYWSGKITLGDVFAISLKSEPYNLIVDNNELFPTIIQNSNGMVLGLIYNDRMTIKISIDTKKIVCRSRSRNCIWIKGANSGNTFDIISANLSCEKNSIRLVVSGKKFCHLNSESCFGHSDPSRSNIKSIYNLIKNKTHTEKSYTSKILEDKNIIITKMLEEMDELIRSNSTQSLINESSDLLYFIILFLIKNKISFDEIEHEMNKRRWLSTNNRLSVPDLDNRFRIGIVDYNYIVEYLKNLLNIDIILPTGRDLHIKVSDSKYQIIKLKPKDIPMLLNCDYIDSVISFEDIIQEYPVSVFKPNLKPIKSKSVDIVVVVNNDMSMEKLYEINKTRKLVIMAEYTRFTETWTTKNNLNCKIHKVYGSAESYLCNELCDMCVVVHDTGKTLLENNLKILDILTTTHMNLFVMNNKMDKFLKNI